MKARKQFFLLCILLVVILVSFAANAQDEGPVKLVSWQQRGGSRAVGMDSDSRQNVAVGFADHYINIYDSHGDFVHGIAMDFDHDYLFGYDEQDRLIIIPDHEPAQYAIDPSGTIQKLGAADAQTVKRFKENRLRTRIQAGDAQYELHDALGIRLLTLFDYTKLVRKDASGVVEVIYDGSWEYVVGIFGGVILILLSALCLSVLIFRKVYRT